jgi:hypothetical protein
MAAIQRREAGVPTKPICVRLPIDLIERVDDYQRKEMLTQSFAIENLIVYSLNIIAPKPESEVTADETESRAENESQTENNPEEDGELD